MLIIEINNPEIEESLKQLYGTNKQSIANTFADFAGILKDAPSIPRRSLGNAAGDA